MANSASTSKKKKTGKPAAAKKTAAAQKRQPKPPAEPTPPAPPRRREIAGALFALLGVMLIICIFNDEGSVNVFFTRYFKMLLGWGFWAVAPACLAVGWTLFFHHGRPVSFRVFCLLMLPVLFGTMAHLLYGEDVGPDFEITALIGELAVSGAALNSGGVIGGLAAVGLESAFSLVGAFVILFVLFAAFLICGLRIDITGMADKLKERATAPYEPEPEAEKAETTDPAPRTAPVRQSAQPRRAKPPRPTVTSAPMIDIPLGEDDEPLLPRGELRDSASAAQDERTAAAKARVRRKTEEPPKVEHVDFDEPLPVEELQPDWARRESRPVRTEKAVPAPKAAKRASPVRTAEISDPPRSEAKKLAKKELAAETQAISDAIHASDAQTGYEFPPLSLLRAGSGAVVDGRDEIQTNRERLEGALHSFNISAAIVGVIRGPTVTRYDIELEQGVKLSRVTNLAGDLALALGVVNVRIAPIPDKISTVGIEVPNKIVSTVYLRDILGSERFQTAKSKLSFALGKDIGGDAIVGNIAKLPHLLIAGTTGSGKSVCMNSLILSLLYKARPDEVRLIMIDPKMVELGIYNGIPHLYVPVVTDPKKAAGALQWSVVEMLKRYRLFSEAGVRDLENYNNHCRSSGEETMPQIVVVIDELADLMMIASKEVEESICRVAQMGRAAGIHLVIATQRPSADVITGLMKANIPSRIAFAVSSAMESRIILDQGGAEKLVGMGDMLFSPIGIGKPRRIQGAFVSDEEREEVVSFIKEHAGPADDTQSAEIGEYMDNAANKEDGKGSKGSASSSSGESDSALGSEYDEMLPQAVEAVLEMKQCSVSSLQRRVKLGYSRAARIVDQMEELGIVGPYEGAKPRTVLIDRDGWHSIQVQLGLANDDDLELAQTMSRDAEDSYDSEL